MRCPDVGNRMEPQPYDEGAEPICVHCDTPYTWTDNNEQPQFVWDGKEYAWNGVNPLVHPPVTKERKRDIYSIVGPVASITTLGLIGFAIWCDLMFK